MLDALLLGGERFEQGLNRGAVGMLSGLAALQVGLNLREISVEGSCHRKHPGELGWQDCMSRGEKSQKAGVCVSSVAFINASAALRTTPRPLSW